MWSGSAVAQTPAEAAIPKLDYEAVADFFQLPPGANFVEPAGVAVNSKGHIYGLLVAFRSIQLACPHFLVQP